MNYFCKRYSWLMPLCIVAIWGIWATQVVSAQVDAVDLTASPNSLPAMPGGVVTVTITYTVTEPTQLYYYPPSDFEINNNDGALPDPDNTPPPDLNGSQRLRWDTEESGSKNVVLRVAAGATVGNKPHRAALANDTTSDDLLILTEPFVEAAQPAAVLAPDLQIISASPEPYLVEPGQAFTVTVIIQNSGDGPAADVELALESEDQTFTGLQTFPIGLVGAGQRVTRTYLVGTANSIEDGPHTLSVKLLNGGTGNDNQPVIVMVKQPPQLPELELIDQEVSGSDLGKRGLRLTFQNNGAALSPDDRLVLSSQPENVLVVQQAQLNGNNNLGQLQQGGGHAWSELPPIDWRNEDTFVLDISEMVVNSGFTNETDVQISLIDSADNSLGPHNSLSSDTIAKLAEGALAPIATPQPIQTTITPPPSENPEPPVEQSLLNEAENTNTDEPPSEPEDDANDNNSDLWQWLLGGVIVVAVLLLVATGIYLLSHSRRQAKQAKMIPISDLKGQPSLKSSNGRSFPITSFPFTIGRGEGNNLIIDETFPQWESMSRHHARIVQHQQGYVIEDMGSQNKLRVQGRLTDRNLLRNGWQILIGGVEFTFYDGSVTPGGSA